MKVWHKASRILGTPPFLSLYHSDASFVPAGNPLSPHVLRRETFPSRWCCLGTTFGFALLLLRLLCGGLFFCRLCGRLGFCGRHGFSLLDLFRRARYTVPRQLPLRQRRGPGPRQQPAVLSELDGEQQRGGKPRHGYQRRRARVSRTRLLGRRAESVCPPDSSLPDSVDLYLREPALTANPVFPVQDTPNRKASEHRMFVAGAEEPEYRSYRAMWAPQSRR